MYINPMDPSWDTTFFFDGETWSNCNHLLRTAGLRWAAAAVTTNCGGSPKVSWLEDPEKTS